MKRTLLQITEDENLFLDESKSWGTDKLTKHPYAEEYDVLFDAWRDKPVKLLEIGAYHGASTIMWDKFFPLGDITVVDIEPRLSLQNIKGRVDENRTRILIGDAYTKEFADTLGSFDIINDDGPHSLDSMLKCAELYFSKLNDNGILVIEDIPNEEWIPQIIEKLPPNTKTKIVDYTKQNRGASDSLILIAWK